MERSALAFRSPSNSLRPTAPRPAMRFFRRRSILLPTVWGWGSLALAFGALSLGFWFGTEPFLSLTERVPADVLVVEAWISADAAEFIAAEFRTPGSAYEAIVLVGALSGESWSRNRTDHVRGIRNELLRLGVPAKAIVSVNVADSGTQRTFASAMAARDALSTRPARGINVVTRGVHARRSRLVFAKAFGPKVPTGIISWSPAAFAHEAWWQSSLRATDLLKEAAGYAFELTCDSGR